MGSSSGRKLHDLGSGPAHQEDVVSMTYLDRRPGEFASAAKLLAGIHREMRVFKWGRKGIMLQYDSRFLSADEARNLLNEFFERVRESVAGG